MSTDTDRVVNFAPSFHQFWSLPFQIAVSLYLLHQQVILSLSFELIIPFSIFLYFVFFPILWLSVQSYCFFPGWHIISGWSWLCTSLSSSEQMAG